MPEPQPSSDVPAQGAPMTLQILAVVIFTFLCYLSIGIPLAVVPGYVHGDLGYSSVVAGLVISVQYLATFVTRPMAGRMTDALGAKKTVQRGLIGCTISGVLLILAAALREFPLASLAALLASRLALGLAESFCSTGAIMWGIGLVGHGNNAKVISWNGVATYGALAIGAPLGAVMMQSLGFLSLGILITALSVFGAVLASRKKDGPIIHGERLPFFSVFSRVLPHGLGLALGSVGFGSLATFVTLFYASKHWPHAPLTLTVFGTLFVGSRLLFGNSIKALGGFRVAIASLSIEAIGLLLVWQAQIPQVAIIGAALTGLGFSLVFPSLGVEAVALVPPASRGTALSVYSVFLDASLGITGPIAGLVAGGFGYAAVYLFAAMAAVVGAILSFVLYHRNRAGIPRRSTA